MSKTSEELQELADELKRVIAEYEWILKKIDEVPRRHGPSDPTDLPSPDDLPPP